MQERYLGDSHDFLKYALLRHLNRELGMSVGVNWYLTNPELVDAVGNNDGQKRHHLRGNGWPATDPDLFDKILRFDEPGTRVLSNIENWEILPPGTTFHAEELVKEERASWHAAALRQLDGADLVFLDPDNGFEVPSMTRKTSPKYALFREAVDFARLGKVVVAIQFARQCDPLQRARCIRTSLYEHVGPCAALPVIRGRVAPNILFLTVAPKGMESVVARALCSFATNCHKSEIID